MKYRSPLKGFGMVLDAIRTCKSMLLGYGERKGLIDMTNFLISNWCQGHKKSIVGLEFLLQQRACKVVFNPKLYLESQKRGCTF